MNAQVVRTQEEIDAQVGKATHIACTVGTRYTSLSYEEGVTDALRWVTGETDETPIEDEAEAVPAPPG